MLGCRLVRLDEAEHLDLVELMHPEDPARVLPGGTGLAAKAAREARIAPRQLVAGEDLVVVQRCERHLGGPDEIQIVVLEPVDLLLGVGQEPGAVERALAHEDGRDHGLEARRAERLQRVADERELQEDELSAQVREPRT